MTEKQFFVYIMANGKHGTIYTGVTSNLVGRVWQHKNHVFEDSFTDRYDVTDLVWVRGARQRGVGDYPGEAFEGLEARLEG